MEKIYMTIEQILNVEGINDEKIIKGLFFIAYDRNIESEQNILGYGRTKIDAKQMAKDVFNFEKPNFYIYSNDKCKYNRKLNENRIY